MKTSTQASYDRIFSIRVGSTLSIAQNATIGDHRGLYVATSAIVDVTFTNLDNTTSSVRFPSGISVVLPLRIKSYLATSNGDSLYMYGLL